MNKIIGIMLVGLLGFLGCGDDDDRTSPVGEAIPVAPYGIIHENPTYIWHSLQWATKYRIVVVGKNSTETPIIEEEYTAEEAGCESGDGLCMASPEATFSPSSEWQWKVRACANDGCDYWSEPLEFKTSEDWGDPIPFVGGGGSRFTQNNDGTVYDNDTGLTWLKSADYAGLNVYYPECANECARFTREYIPIGPPGNTYFYEWRVPSSNELATLHYAVPNHPFTGGFDASGFFDGTPFTLTTGGINQYLGPPEFWSSTCKWIGNDWYCYVWTFSPLAVQVLASPAYQLICGPGLYARAECWCVGKRVELMLGP